MDMLYFDACNALLIIKRFHLVSSQEGRRKINCGLALALLQAKQEKHWHCCRPNVEEDS